MYLAHLNLPQKMSQAQWEGVISLLPWSHFYLSGLTYFLAEHQQYSQPFSAHYWRFINGRDKEANICVRYNYDSWALQINFVIDTSAVNALSSNISCVCVWLYTTASSL